MYNVTQYPLHFFLVISGLINEKYRAFIITYQETEEVQQLHQRLQEKTNFSCFSLESISILRLYDACGTSCYKADSNEYSMDAQREPNFREYQGATIPYSSIHCTVICGGIAVAAKSFPFLEFSRTYVTWSV